MNYVKDTISVGMRVEVSPATDVWMMGDRYGEVVKNARKYIHVKMDRSGRVLQFLPVHIYDAWWGVRGS